MKLPKPLISVPGSVIDRPLQIDDAEIIEAIVRDCAKVAGEPNGFAGTEYALGREDAESAILRRYGLGEREMSTNDHTHTADCDAHGCAYKEPAVEQETDAEGRSALKAPSDTVRPAPAAAPDAQTLKDDDEGLRLSALDAAEVADSGRRGIDAMVFRACALRLEHLLHENAGLRELFQESQRRRVEHEDTIGDLRRQLAEAQTYADPLLFQQFITEKQRAETAEAALAAFKQEYADMKLALAAERAARDTAISEQVTLAQQLVGAQENLMACRDTREKLGDKWLRAERQRDAAADLAREKALNACLAIASTGGSAVHCVEAIRSTLTDPTAVKEIINGRKDYIRLRAHLATIATGHKLLQEFDAARTARNGEEGKHA